MDRDTAGIEEIIKEEVLSPAPDMDSALARIQTVTDLDRDNAREVLYRIVERLNHALFSPLHKLELVLVEGCNLACQYCFEGTVLNSKLGRRKWMAPETIERSIDLFVRYSGPVRRLSVTLFGGEPTLHYDGIRHAVACAEQQAKSAGKSVAFNMTSNGVLFNEEMVDYFARHNVKVLLSIDGTKTAHDKYRLDKSGRGTFDEVMRGMRLLKTRQPWIGIKMTVMPDNAGTIVRSVRELHRQGVNQFLIGHATGVPWSAKARGLYADQMRELHEWYQRNRSDELRISGFDEDQPDGGFFGCSAGRSRISVAVNGNITGCSRISTLDDKSTPGLLGNLDYGLFVIRRRMEMSSCGTLIDNTRKLGIDNEYRGGCFATNFEETGSLFKPNLQQHEFSLLLRDLRRPSRN